MGWGWGEVFPVNDSLLPSVLKALLMLPMFLHTTITTVIIVNFSIQEIVS